MENNLQTFDDSEYKKWLNLEVGKTDKSDREVCMTKAIVHLGMHSIASRICLHDYAGVKEDLIKHKDLFGYNVLQKEYLKYILHKYITDDNYFIMQEIFDLINQIKESVYINNSADLLKQVSKKIENEITIYKTDSIIKRKVTIEEVSKWLN